MKFWKEKELNPVEKMDFWKGEYINKLEENEVFVFGANPLLSFKLLYPFNCPK